MAKLNRSERPFRLYRRSLVPRERKIYYADQDFIGLVYSTFSRTIIFQAGEQLQSLSSSLPSP